ncbi:hypothetical protein SAMN05421876_104218 [Kaistella jeonii]|nr:hypothetical protein SAMN05421876_104218 [Kaistella jeonii]VEI97242.1 Uncharacterised protein [Kaistella jeonii]
MAVFLQQHHVMKNLYFLTFSVLTFISLTSCKSLNSPSIISGKESKSQNILYFNPEVFPDLEEIKEPTYSAFYAAVSGKINDYRNYKMLRVDSHIPFDSVDVESIKEFCRNNNAQFAIIPKVKYFKVGLGKYVFSNQVIVSMKLYDATGKFLTEADYDTYKKNARILGSAENSIKIGTEGAMNFIAKDLTKNKKAL